jgi:hypothetical protein
LIDQLVSFISSSLNHDVPTFFFCFTHFDFLWSPCLYSSIFGDKEKSISSPKLNRRMEEKEKNKEGFGKKKKRG